MLWGLLVVELNDKDDGASSHEDVVCYCSFASFLRRLLKERKKRRSRIGPFLVSLRSKDWVLKISIWAYGLST